jgi:hypothetical protein
MKEMIMSKADRPGYLRGEELEKAVRQVVAAMILDIEVTPSQINMAEVARRVGCSRTVLYQKNYKRFIAEASQKKAESFRYEKKLARARKPSLIIMKDAMERLRAEREEWKKRYEEVTRSLARVLINIQRYGDKHNKGIEDLLTMPVEPLEIKRVAPFMKSRVKGLDRWQIK